MVGTVKWFDAAKGYGFIGTGDGGGPDYFVHYSQIKMDGYKELVSGERVTFSPHKDEHGRYSAFNVRKTGKTTARERYAASHGNESEHEYEYEYEYEYEEA